MSKESLNDGKKRNRSEHGNDEAIQENDDLIFAMPDCKRALLNDLPENDELVHKSPSSSQEMSEEEDIPNATAAWWRKFYHMPARLHTDTIMLSEELFLEKVLPPIDPKWNDKVMYAMSYEVHGFTWTHYECVSKDKDRIIKAFVVANPDFKISLGELEGRGSDVRLPWPKVVKWESSDPRTMQEYDPIENDCYSDQVLSRAVVPERIMSRI